MLVNFNIFSISQATFQNPSANKKHSQKPMFLITMLWWFSKEYYYPQNAREMLDWYNFIPVSSLVTDPLFNGCHKNCYQKMNSWCFCLYLLFLNLFSRFLSCLLIKKNHVLSFIGISNYVIQFCGVEDTR